VRERYFIFMKGMPASKKVGNLCIRLIQKVAGKEQAEATALTTTAVRAVQCCNKDWSWPKFL